jgi:broad specificity phosphatase PhoE
MIYLIRHGEPAAGWGEAADPGLSALGRKQAEAAARILAEAGAKRPVTSPLARCRETVRPFEKLMETHARIDPLVGEVKEPAGIADRAAWLKSAMTGTWSGAGLQGWAESVLKTVEAMPKDAAVFSHFVAINAVVGLLCGDDRVAVFRPGHCSITKLERRAGRLHVLERGQEGALVLL